MAASGAAIPLSGRVQYQASVLAVALAAAVAAALVAAISAVPIAAVLTAAIAALVTAAVAAALVTAVPAVPVAAALVTTIAAIAVPAVTVSAVLTAAVAGAIAVSTVRPVAGVAAVRAYGAATAVSFAVAVAIVVMRPFIPSSVATIVSVRRGFVPVVFGRRGIVGTLAPVVRRRLGTRVAATGPGLDTALPVVFGRPADPSRDDLDITADIGRIATGAIRMGRELRRACTEPGEDDAIILLRDCARLEPAGTICFAGIRRFGLSRDQTGRSEEKDKHAFREMAPSAIQNMSHRHTLHWHS